MAAHIDDIHNEAVVMFLACIHRGAQSSHRLFIRSVLNVESYQINGNHPKEHSPDGFAEAVCQPVYVYVYMRACVHANVSCVSVSVCLYVDFYDCS